MNEKLTMKRIEEFSDEELANEFKARFDDVIIYGIKIEKRGNYPYYDWVGDDDILNEMLIELMCDINSTEECEDEEDEP